jgi:hypothetical protein
MNGAATVTLTLTDDATRGGAALTTAPQTFTISVTAVNDVPSFRMEVRTSWYVRSLIDSMKPSRSQDSDIIPQGSALMVIILFPSSEA